jgi:hypothetical protein
MQTRIQKHQQYSLMPYIPFAARRIHAACATSAQPTIEFPRSMTQVQSIDQCAHTFFFIRANSDAQYVPSLRRWRFEMKHSPFIEHISKCQAELFFPGYTAE